jgi:hypothetical protein
VYNIKGVVPLNGPGVGDVLLVEGGVGEGMGGEVGLVDVNCYKGVLRGKRAEVALEIEEPLAIAAAGVEEAKRVRALVYGFFWDEEGRRVGGGEGGFHNMVLAGEAGRFFFVVEDMFEGFAGGLGTSTSVVMVKLYWERCREW